MVTQCGQILSKVKLQIVNDNVYIFGLRASCCRLAPSNNRCVSSFERGPHSTNRGLCRSLQDVGEVWSPTVNVRRTTPSKSTPSSLQQRPLQASLAALSPRPPLLLDNRHLPALVRVVPWSFLSEMGRYLPQIPGPRTALASRPLPWTSYQPCMASRDCTQAWNPSSR